MHVDRLIAALNKHWRPLSEKQYWEEMDIPMTNNAITVAQFPEEISKWVFESKIKREAFSTGGKLY